MFAYGEVRDVPKTQNNRQESLRPLVANRRSSTLSSKQTAGDSIYVRKSVSSYVKLNGRLESVSITVIAARFWVPHRIIGYQWNNREPECSIKVPNLA